VNKPGVYEIELGLPIAKFLAEYAGGTLEERALKAVIPGGSSVPVMTASEALKTCLSYEGCECAGTMLGSGGMIVIDESACVVRCLADIAKFYHHESCGQCTPCREGCGWIKKICDRIEAGSGRDGDPELLLSIADNMMGKTICVFADALAMPVRSFVTKFREDFEKHIRSGKCPSPL
jgi:NADH-quinone oxidoreductase subunit F